MLWTPHSCSIGPPSCSSMDWSMSLPFLATPRSRPSEDREEREEEALGQSPCREPATRPRHCPSARYGQSQQLRSTEKKITEEALRHSRSQGRRNACIRAGQSPTSLAGWRARCTDATWKRQLHLNLHSCLLDIYTA